MANENLYKVRLVSTASGLSVPFQVTPDLIENRNVNYKTLDPIHMPGNIYVYGNTSSRTFNISNAKFVSRTPEEATRTMRYLHMLRSWTTPYFGDSSSTLSPSQRRDRNSQQYRDLESSRRYKEIRTFYGS